MFLKKITLPILLGSFSIVFSQEKIASLNYELEDSKGVSTIVDDEDKKIILQLNDRLKIDFIALNDSFQETGRVSTNKAPKEKSTYLGYSKNDQNYYTYWDNAKEEEIFVKKLDFKNKIVTNSKIPFVLKDEILFTSMTVNNVFHALTILKNTNTINVYIFNEGQLEKKSIDCSNLKFINYENRPVNFWKLYSERKTPFYNDGFRNINTETNSSLVLSTQKKKVYLDNESLILSFDNNYTFNQNLIINLKDYTVTQKVVQQESVLLKDDFSHTESNSFILNDKVFLIKTSDEQIFVTIKDLENNIFKKIIYSTTDLGSFINSDVIQENESTKNKRILEKPNQFVRKVHASNPAITGIYENNKYYMTIGCVSEPQQSTGSIIAAGIISGVVGGVVGGLAYSLITHNNQAEGVNSYSNKKIIYLRCVLDDNLNHVDEKIGDTNFDKLRAFIEEDKTHEYPSVFAVGKKLIYIGYDTKKKTYDFYQF